MSGTFRRHIVSSLLIFIKPDLDKKRLEIHLPEASLRVPLRDPTLLYSRQFACSDLLFFFFLRRIQSK